MQYKHGKSTVTRELYGGVQDTMRRHYAVVSSESDVILTRVYFQQMMGTNMTPEMSVNIQESFSQMLVTRGRKCFHYMMLPEVRWKFT